MLRIRAMQEADLEPVRRFTDRAIGEGYYSAEELRTIYQRSQKNGEMFTLVLVDDLGEIFGVRITYPPGQWESGKGKGLQPQKWPHPKEETAYFQSLFLSDELRGQGWGGKLSLEALKILRKAGTKGVVCHSWKESPNNSSTRYLQKMGFESISDHPLYWADVDYNCTKCLKPPCQCTAQEMYLDLERKHEHLLLA